VKFTHNIPRGTRQPPQMRLLPGLADATRRLNRLRYIIKVVNSHPQRFQELYGYRVSLGESHPRSTLHVALFVRSRSSGLMWRRCTCTFQGYVILHLNFLFRRIVFLVCGVAGPHEQLFPMDLCIAICTKHCLSAPDGYPHVGQGEERGSYFDVATDILGSL
jgi:hypothetical protein